MILSIFTYPLSEPDIVSASVYESPANALMVYSRGNPYLDSFFIPSRLIPQAVAGHTYEFKAYHDSNDGLYPALLLASNVYVTTNTVYGFQDVSASMVSLIVTPTSVKVGYIDVDSGQLVVIEHVQLVARATITEAAHSTSNVVQLKRQLANRTTVAPNNLPRNISSKHWHLTTASLDTVIYTPGANDVYAYMSLRIFAVEDSIVYVKHLSTEPGALPVSISHKVAANSQLRLDNLVVVAGETITLLVVGECDVYVGTMHMGNVS